MSGYYEGEIKKLGFGLMRLPRKGLFIDIEQTKKMVDLFMEAGFTYYDTAHIYPGSEDAAKKVLVDRYPRDSFLLATKLYAAMAPTRKAARQQFYTSLERTGAGYFDYYLLHTLMHSNVKRYDRFELWDFVKELKDEGKIRHYGFSFHDGPELLEELLNEHPDVDFVQLQINYADWENPSVTSRANYEIARKYGKKIVIMEPVKGGVLANPPKEVRALFEESAPGKSPASWAIRFAASLDGVLTVLSGMSDIPQMEDNISYMKDFRPLSEEEYKVIAKAEEILGRSHTIPCTSCGYCKAGCPKQIPIPEIFAAMNKRLSSGRIDEAKAAYESAVDGKGRASDCIHCKKCEAACPQHLPVTKHLEECKTAMEADQ
ncbi:MAG: aldo/keto reductase [Lachnospiraceae bacterium]|nr:aldo/keto reductase [Lachnospiraceae bacterium]